MIKQKQPIQICGIKRDAYKTYGKAKKNRIKIKTKPNTERNYIAFYNMMIEQEIKDTQRTLEFLDRYKKGMKQH